MKKSSIIYLILLFIILVALFFYYYAYSIYEIKYEISNQIIFCNSNSTAEIRAFGLNALGYKIAFRTISAHYEIIEGQDLVEILNNDFSKGELKIKALSKSGIVIIRATSQYSLLPAVIEIPVQVPSA